LKPRAFASSSSRSRDRAQYGADRLARDHPDITHRLAAGEFRSVAEAEHAARGETAGLTVVVKFRNRLLPAIATV
jgi:hypothetical protein